jgi:hypothetical protein
MTEESINLLRTLFDQPLLIEIIDPLQGALPSFSDDICKS